MLFARIITFLFLGVLAQSLLATRLCPNCNREYLEEDGISYQCPVCPYHEYKPGCDPQERNEERAGGRHWQHAYQLPGYGLKLMATTGSSGAAPGELAFFVGLEFRHSDKQARKKTPRRKPRSTGNEAAAEAEIDPECFQEMSGLLSALYTIGFSTTRINQQDCPFLHSVEALVASYENDNSAADAFLGSHGYHSVAMEDLLHKHSGYYILALERHWIPIVVTEKHIYLVINECLVYKIKKAKIHPTVWQNLPRVDIYRRNDPPPRRQKKKNPFSFFKFW